MEEPAVDKRFTRSFDHYASVWPSLLHHLKGQPDLRFLEIGCFEGQATIWLLDNILTDPSSEIWVVDPLIVDWYGRRFERNIKKYGQRVEVIQGYSQTVLRSWRHNGFFDFAYIDGAHDAKSVLTDAVLVWPMMKDEGIVVFDDYEWAHEAEEWETARPAVDSFVRCFRPSDAFPLDGQYVVRK